jgi:predicted nucleotidyltransferase
MARNQELRNITEAIMQVIPAERIYLFGSHAYGTPDEESDYDLFVVIPDGGLRPLEAAQKARRALSTVNRRTPVDILADYRSRFDERKQFNTLERKIWNEGMVLYERK